MKQTLIAKFLGVDRWKLLFKALGEATKYPKKPNVSIWILVTSLLIASTPIVLTFISQNQNTYLPTLAFGVCAVLAIIIRKGIGVKSESTHSFKEALSLSHTAVALGCIPAVIIIFLYPDMLAQRHDILVESTEQAMPSGEKPSLAFIITMCLLYASWASVTEEVLFRFLLISTLRRWSFFSNQRSADMFACLTSALIFGFAHYATWGLAASIALTGIGIGFGLAYLATQERLEPVLFYHFVFDILSIAAAQ